MLLSTNRNGKVQKQFKVKLFLNLFKNYLNTYINFDYIILKCVIND